MGLWQLLQWVMQQQSGLIRFPFHLAAHTHTHNFGNFQTLSVRSGCVSFRFVFTRIFSHSIFHLTFALASLLLCSCAHLIELQTLRSSQFSQLGRSQVEATVPAQLSLPFFAFSSHYSLTPLSLPLLLQATSL